jgi:hypothetical protein
LGRTYSIFILLFNLTLLKSKFEFTIKKQIVIFVIYAVGFLIFIFLPGASRAYIDISKTFLPGLIYRDQFPLWHLQHLVEVGDLVSGLTWRREHLRVDKLRPERLEKRPVNLTIKVEGIEFHRSSNVLRLLGTITKGQNLGKHHALSIEPGSRLVLIKLWKPEHLDRLVSGIRQQRKVPVDLLWMET